MKGHSVLEVQDGLGDLVGARPGARGRERVGALSHGREDEDPEQRLRLGGAPAVWASRDVGERGLGARERSAGLEGVVAIDLRARAPLEQHERPANRDVVAHAEQALRKREGDARRRVERTPIAP